MFFTTALNALLLHSYVLKIFKKGCNYQLLLLFQSLPHCFINQLTRDLSAYSENCKLQIP